ncbi:hypothetical protein [Shewanella sp.]|uniref:hypothetical protein n=1 Tax=Shewanella sp. TaxID=50422 RepID=UPI003568026A
MRITLKLGSLLLVVASAVLIAAPTSMQGVSAGTELPEAAAQPVIQADATQAQNVIDTELKAADEIDASSQAISGESLHGSWMLVSGRYLDGEGKWVDYRSLGLSAIKVVSKGHFSFTTVKTVKNKTEFWAAGAGEYKLEGNLYTEYPSLNSFEVPKGQGFGFEIALIGNEWHTRRVEAGILKEEEVWRRLD